MSGVLVVTGAGRGIGAACAKLGARYDYSVCVNYSRSRESAEAVAQQIRDSGRTAIAVQADVSRREEAKRLFDIVDKELGPVTALINNAGVTGPLVAVEDMDEKGLFDVFAINFYSLYWCCGEAVLRMAKKHGGKGGAIVNIGSIASRSGGLPGMSAYAATKGAMGSFTVALAKEVGREGIRVNCIRPGMTKTDILEPLGGEKMTSQVGPTIPLGRVGDPSEIAEAALWVLSDKASYVHGVIWDVSGGR